MDFEGLNLVELDKNLSIEEKEEWQAIYASYRGQSIITGEVVGVDLHEFKYIPKGEKKTVVKTVRCLIIINYRVKVIIPQTEVFIDIGEEYSHILRSMCGAKIDYVITHIDREAGFAVASRKMALENIRKVYSKRPIKEEGTVTVDVIAVGKNVCTVTYRGYDVMLPQRDVSYSIVRDLRESLQPGDKRKAVVKSFDKDNGILQLSIKEATPHPFEGIEMRHPIGSTRIASIVGKYGGGIFCRMSDNITDVLCSYVYMQQDKDFKVGDKVEVLIKRYNNEKKLIYGKIIRKLH
ncbi:MAG: hypothetical protein K5768_05260 [Firmicutes bacterium]|nr:hypothetical protein [Bacillota bacterium]